MGFFYFHLPLETRSEATVLNSFFNFLSTDRYAYIHTPAGEKLKFKVMGVHTT
jgi:hypothetical protein